MRPMSALNHLPGSHHPCHSAHNVLFPTDGKPTNPTVAIPVLATSKPAPGPPPLLAGAMSSRLSLASLARN